MNIDRHDEIPQQGEFQNISSPSRAISFWSSARKLPHNECPRIIAAILAPSILQSLWVSRERELRWNRFHGNPTQHGGCLTGSGSRLCSHRRSRALEWWTTPNPNTTGHRAPGRHPPSFLHFLFPFFPPSIFFFRHDWSIVQVFYMYTTTGSKTHASPGTHLQLRTQF